MPNIALVDADVGNFFSVTHALKTVGCQVTKAQTPNDILLADGIVLPGVGAFASAMGELNRRNLVNPLKAAALRGVPILGVCLGMQLLMKASSEHGVHHGLGLIDGEVLSLRTALSDGVKVPNVGWSECKLMAPQHHPITLGLPDNPKMYFTHSYFVELHDNLNMLFSSEYHGLQFCSGAAKGNIIGVQFHPEKSGELGLLLYENFAHLCGKAA